jgi:hypothetical protein
MYNEEQDLKRRIAEFLNELVLLKTKSYVWHYTPLRTPGLKKDIGVEIYFDDEKVDMEKMSEVKSYIENKYKFKVDDSKLIPKILLVEYKL